MVLYKYHNQLKFGQGSSTVMFIQSEFSNFWIQIASLENIGKVV